MLIIKRKPISSASMWQVKYILTVIAADLIRFARKRAVSFRLLFRQINIAVLKLLADIEFFTFFDAGTIHVVHIY
jgi:hypothetical protein